MAGKFPIDPQFLPKLEFFVEELERWNRVHKLTNYRGEEIWEQIYDSFYPIEQFKLRPKEVVDVGTGAGFPGLVLGILYPKTKFYLVEPLKKRYSFLNYLKSILALPNLEVLPTRVEEVKLKGIDLITSRAVGDYSLLWTLTSHLRTPTTQLLLYQGPNAPVPTLPHRRLKRGGRIYYLIGGPAIGNPQGEGEKRGENGKS
jgi:16S rRNA (guanine527-N7)-methyltransferase